KEVIKEFTKKPEVMIEKYQAELGCSREYVLEFIHTIPQLDQVYGLLKEKYKCIPPSKYMFTSAIS
ncbi:hypothetical protein, partial [uncultured Microscilla sp.]|uniref:hypothetical protein n=1 Tax=uncultured Microscilla sp. TaxID=432653 RepID=UPI00261E83D7